MDDLKEQFSSVGTEFIATPEELSNKLSGVQTYLFDWDGVFNDGTKGEGVTSHFNEADSMGINMLRFSHWLRTGNIPYCGIITGRKNQSAVHFSERESFHSVCMGFTNKLEALKTIDQDPSNACFFFDDILDLSIASQCRLRIMIGREQSPIMNASVKERGWCDLITGSTGGSHAIREACELLIALNGNWEEVLSSRVSFDERYRDYLVSRNAVNTEMHEKSR